MSLTRDRLEGELLGFTWQAEDGGYAVARLRTEDEGRVIAVGPVGHVTVGQHVALEGRWQEHSQYGRQFKVDKVLIEDPRTRRGLVRYLGSGAVKGLGPTFAQRVVDAFGLDTLRIIEDQPERLREVSGIGEKRLEQILAHWARDKQHREVHASLRGYGIGQALANRIVEQYGKDALGIVTRRPYQLASEVRGVGFRTADEIARANGIAKDDPARAEAAAVHLLRKASGQGHCFVPQGVLTERAAALDVPAAQLQAALDRLVFQGGVVRRRDAVSDPQQAPVYLPELELAEHHVAERLAAMARPAGGAAPDLAPIEAALGLALSAGQRAAVGMALRHGVAVITGGPGTGKTTIVQVLVAAAQRNHETWLLAAPTGRAARRLSETTGQDARTLHRLLEFNPRTGQFNKGGTDPLDAHGVLVDEASMVDLPLMASLVAALPDGCRLVLVGDADQLPSVGPGRVLGDLVASGAVPVATLSEVYRQAAGSGIVRNAWRVNGGAVPLSSERDPDSEARDFFLVHRDDALAAQAALLEVVTRRLPRLGFDPHTDVQVLAPMHNGLLGTVALNERLQATLNPQGAELKRGGRRFRVGDRVIQVRNDYDHDIFNGDIGRVLSAGAAGLVVDFDGREVVLSGEALGDLEPAWAISIHKSQGSEYPAVVVALHRSHRVMLRRNLLYTAMTRARRFCCVIGDGWALETAVRERGGDERWTRLGERLAQG